jgi:digeranylgeranylglycerophospholipid reductase
MQKFDVVVVGAGPAGGHCARVLAKAGRKVLLVERHENFDRNSFSSAGTPLETLAQYDLPDTVIGSLWQKLVIVTSNRSGTWESAQPLGAVLDFAKLREFLANDVKAHGGEVWLGCKYVKHQSMDGQSWVTFKQKSDPAQPDAAAVTVATAVIVDATGPARSVMYPPGIPKPDFLEGTGIEYLIEVNAADYATQANALTFFLGHKWMPKGYSWIFPMEPHRLKVGAGLIAADHQIVDRTASLKYYVDLIINDYLKTTSYQILDVHGSTLKYSRGLQDVYQQGNVIAIGDAVSTVNFLGGEGIRHAMQSAEIAAPYIQTYLQDHAAGFNGYQTEMHQVFLEKWKLSEKLGLKKYLEDSDELVDKVIAYLQPLKLEDVVDILFYYKFERLSKGLTSYLLRKITTFFQQLQNRLGLQ